MSLNHSGWNTAVPKREDLIGQQLPSDEKRTSPPYRQETTNDKRISIDEEPVSIFSKQSVRFALFFLCILCPLLGLVLGWMMSLTPFANSGYVSSRMIHLSCVFLLIWISIFLIAFPVSMLLNFLLTL